MSTAPSPLGKYEKRSFSSKIKSVVSQRLGRSRQPECRRYQDPLAEPKSVSERPTVNTMQAGRNRSPPLAGTQAQAESQPQKDQREEAARFDIAAHNKLRHAVWVQRNEPKPYSENDFRHAMRVMIVEAAAYHQRRGSSSLNRRIAGALLSKNPSGMPNDLPVDVTSCKVSSQVVRQLFVDVDNICDHYQDGPRLAAQALQEMALWRTSS